VCIYIGGARELAVCGTEAEDAAAAAADMFVSVGLRRMGSAEEYGRSACVRAAP
jgi:hypothetical protein